MSSCCFLSVSHTSYRRQISVARLLSPAHGVNRVFNMIDCSHLSISLSIALMILQTSLKGKCGRLRAFWPVANSPYRRTFGILALGVWCTCLIQRRGCCWRRCNWAWVSTMVLVTAGLEQLIPRMRLRSVEASLLSGVVAPSLDAVEQHADWRERYQDVSEKSRYRDYPATYKYYGHYYFPVLKSPYFTLIIFPLYKYIFALFVNSPFIFQIDLKL